MEDTQERMTDRTEEAQADAAVPDGQENGTPAAAQANASAEKTHLHGTDAETAPAVKKKAMKKRRETLLAYAVGIGILLAVFVPMINTARNIITFLWHLLRGGM